MFHRIVSSCPKLRAPQEGWPRAWRAPWGIPLFKAGCYQNNAIVFINIQCETAVTPLNEPLVLLRRHGYKPGSKRRLARDDWVRVSWPWTRKDVDSAISLKSQV